MFDLINILPDTITTYVPTKLMVLKINLRYLVDIYLYLSNM